MVSDLNKDVLFGDLTTFFREIDPSLINSRDELRGETMLHQAVRIGAVEKIKMLMRAGADPEMRVACNRNALHLLCLNGDVLGCDEKIPSAVEAVTDKVQNINDQDSDGFTPIHLACISGNLSLCTELLSLKADVNIPDLEGNTPLHSCCKFGASKTASFLLTKTSMDIKAPNSQGLTAMDLVCSINSSASCKILSLLLSQCPEVLFNPSKHVSGNSPFHWAALCNCPQIMTLLLESEGGMGGLYLRNAADKIPLDEALDNEHDEVVAAIRGSN
eukprot:TRINITY_DN10967_c0_g1_i1.p1 TRINITY_DN10967_c0_g1~~TRINITY_DN10967_c0_g1_i1.p1  ORF type:complete len:274 (+),score=58.78 TRINITY_DN10967_c0_g1_i1:454-1275(+)